MDNLEKIKRHLAKPIPIILKDSEGQEDTFLFKPLNIEQQAILMELNERMKSREKINEDGVEFPTMNKEDLLELNELLINMVTNSIEGTDRETAKSFVEFHFLELSEAIEKLIVKPTDKSAIEKLKKKQEELKRARQSGLQ